MFSTMISSSVLIIMVMAVRALVRGKAGNGMIYALWLLVAVRLIMPVPEFIFQKVTGMEEAGIKSDFSIMNITDDSEYHMGTFIPGTVSKAFAEKKERDGLTVKECIYKSDQILNDILHVVWLSGTVIILTIQILSEKRFRRELIQCREQIGTYLDVGQKVSMLIYEASNISTPILFRSKGFKADIYIPKYLADSTDVPEHKEIMKYAMIHENIHRMHGDIWWSYLRNILAAVYWFHPFVWIAAFLSKRDAEYACDSSVIKTMEKEERILYGNSLLSLVQEKECGALFCTAVSMCPANTEIKERIMMIKKGVRKNIFASVAVYVLVLFMAVVTFTYAKADSGDMDSIQKTDGYWTDKEIKDAKKSVVSYLKKKNQADSIQFYKIKHLHYEQKYSSVILSDSRYNQEQDKMIVLLSELHLFYQIDENVADGIQVTHLVDGGIYPNWMWILKQDNNGEWYLIENSNSIQK